MADTKEQGLSLVTRLGYVRDALKPIPWAKNASGGPSMSDTVQEAIAALTSRPADTGERGVVAWAIINHCDNDKVSISIGTDNPETPEWREQVGAAYSVRPLVYGDALRAQPAGGGEWPPMDGAKTPNEFFNPTPPESGAQGQGWRPIESAPRDGRARLVYVPLNKCIFCVSWREPYDAEDAVMYPAGWYFFGGSGRLTMDPSHYAELPAAPAQPDGVE